MNLSPQATTAILAFLRRNNGFYGTLPELIAATTPEARQLVGVSNSFDPVWENYTVRKCAPAIYLIRDQAEWTPPAPVKPEPIEPTDNYWEPLNLTICCRNSVCYPVR